MKIEWGLKPITGLNNAVFFSSIALCRLLTIRYGNDLENNLLAWEDRALVWWTLLTSNPSTFWVANCPSTAWLKAFLVHTSPGSRMESNSTPTHFSRFLFLLYHTFCFRTRVSLFAPLWFHMGFNNLQDIKDKTQVESKPKPKSKHKLYIWDNSAFWNRVQ